MTTQNNFSPSDLIKSQLVDESISEDSQIDFSPTTYIQSNLENKKLEDAATEADPKTFGDKLKDYLSSGELGKAFSMQMQSGGFGGAPAATPEIARDVAVEAGTIIAMEALFAPIVYYRSK